MKSMIEKKIVNEDLEIELTSFVDDKQNVWFRGKDIAEILGYSNVRKAIWIHVDSEDKQLIGWRTQNGDGRSQTQNRYYTFVNESGFYSLVLSSRLESAKKFKHWVTSQVLPSIRKYGQYILFVVRWLSAKSRVGYHAGKPIESVVYCFYKISFSRMESFR